MNGDSMVVYLRQMHELMTDKDTMQQLMALDKARRGVPENQLTYIGVHNVAQYRWCAMHAVLKSRRNELTFFATYLHDRLRYAMILELTHEMPKDSQDVLKLASSDMPFEEVEQVERALEVGKPALDTGHFVEKENEGYAYHESKENPTYRWNWPWQDYLLVGTPDGITWDTILEEKSTDQGAVFARRFHKPVANVQADLYGWLFQRRRKKIVLYSKKEDAEQVFEGDVDVAHAIETLEKFRRVDREGWLPPAPAPWKCGKCETRDGCPLKQ